MLDRIVNRYLAVADRLLPGRITGFYLVGSAALGAWHADRSDIDFIAVLDGPANLHRLHALHGLGNAATVARAVARGQLGIPGTMNGAFVSSDDLSKPVTQIRPVASHSGPSFKAGRGFDVNPVMWKVLLEQGITVRGPAPDTLGLDPEPAQLRSWNLGQLDNHWRAFAEKSLSTNLPRKPLIPAHRVATARLFGPPRLHHTIATGQIIPKEEAAHYALTTFPARWHPLIRTALAHRIGQTPLNNLNPKHLPHLAGEFILEVITDAQRL
jgi:hypothetical protein